MASYNGSKKHFFQQSQAPFNGLMSTRVVTDLGRFNAYFPSPVANETNSQNDKRDKNKISIGADNKLNDSPGFGGQIDLGTYVRFGLKVNIFLFNTLFNLKIGAPDMSLWYNTGTLFTFYPDDSRQTACTEYEVITNIYSDVRDSESVHWEEEHVQLAYDRQTADAGNVCYPISDVSSKRKRSASLPGVPELPTEPLSANSTLLPPRAELTELSSPGAFERLSSREAGSPERKVPARSAAGIAPVLETRQSTGSMPMPGWGNNPGVNVEPNLYFGDGNHVFDNSEPKFRCRN